MATGSGPMGNRLGASSLATYMATSLPKDASPQIKTPFDAIALAAHAGMIAVGFRLIGLGEDHRIESQSDAENAQPLPAEWNASSTYAFRYRHTQSSMEFLLKVNRLGGKAVVFAIALEHDKTMNFDIVAKEYVSESSLPSTPLSGDKSLADAKRTIQDIFISVGRLGDFGSLLRINIVQKLMPSLQKEGYEETAQTSSSSANNQQEPPGRSNNPPQRDPLRDDYQPPARPYPFDDPLAQAPRRPFPAGEFAPPGFEDEYEINRPPRGGIGGPPGFGNIGHNDLYPPGMGPNDPLRGPGGGFGGGGGGMHPTFDDPLFTGRRGPGGQGGGFDPQAPPGARYDPVGPGGAPRGGAGGFPGGFPGGGGGMGGRPPNPFGGFGDGDFI
ncbi:hypothetical protein LTR04_001243 [Oleoguttula sp. CCFEE 6159]|nr:hypothetical protein LTR04_001243 [Oleoguttula sp. CCFEE 6159]